MPDFRFRLPPIGELTNAQQIAYNYEGGLMVTGGPGSGKTVVSIYRFRRTMLNDQNGMFFTFNRTLMAAVKGTFKQAAEIIFMPSQLYLLIILELPLGRKLIFM